MGLEPSGSEVFEEIDTIFDRGIFHRLTIQPSVEDFAAKTTENWGCLSEKVRKSRGYLSDHPPRPERLLYPAPAGFLGMAFRFAWIEM